ncbi:MAG TPA: ethanolamine ammonia-lyase reactivating factor EutA [Gemmataceae bacterium]|jgi:ethanolamine utilization protein EutA|nr:ethanolamine ammonia-lyase reactivating factor EutA [Gemmataceae bacterium]
MSTVKLIGLDFGTTTSSAVIASAELMHNAVTGRRQVSRLHECYRSEMVFTPFGDEGLDETRLEEHLDTWLAAARVRANELFGGGALVTGLAARQRNADVVARLVHRRLGDALLATADDPRLEAWLAFQASAADLSRKHPDRWFVNLDIGGGTTNIALGKNGEVVETGCLFVGARHVQVEPGSYRVVKLSSVARQLFDHLGIALDRGNSLKQAELDAVLDFYMNLLHGAVASAREVFQDPIARLHEQIPFHLPAGIQEPIVTLSGGVGELVYRRLAGAALPSTTYFGDVGIDVARRLLNQAHWQADFQTYVPAHGGRATVYGLLRHATQISGSTLFLADPAILPLNNMPILGRITQACTDDRLRDILGLARASAKGGCVRVDIKDADATNLAAFGVRLAGALQAVHYPATQPLVLMVKENIGKTLGHYVTQWGALPLKLVVLDEIAIPDAQFVQIGAVRDDVVPVSFHGMN